MINYRINNDFKLSVILDNSNIKLSKIQRLKVRIVSADGRVSFAPIASIAGEHLQLEVKQGQCSRYGRYNIIVSFGIPDVTFDDGYKDVELGSCAAFNIVDVCSNSGDDNEVHLQTDPRYKGDSAYDIARKHGFEGTEAEWLQYLRQPALTAADTAINAAGLAEDATIDATNQADAARTAAAAANNAADEALGAASLADRQAGAATEAAMLAEASAGAASRAATAASDGAVAASVATGNASTAASNANSAAVAASAAAGSATAAANAAAGKVVELEAWRNSFAGVTAELVSDKEYEL